MDSHWMTCLHIIKSTWYSTITINGRIVLPTSASLIISYRSHQLFADVDCFFFRPKVKSLGENMFFTLLFTYLKSLNKWRVLRIKMKKMNAFFCRKNYFIFHTFRTTYSFLKTWLLKSKIANSSWAECMVCASKNQIN